MRAYVITIEDIPESVEAANRCIASAKRRGIEVNTWKAVTPRNTNIYKAAQKLDIPLTYFTEKFSRHPQVVSAFMSHYSLWQRAIDNKETTLILEHDAWFVDGLPDERLMGDIINIGKPSYGNYKTPAWIGERNLFSKDYLPGAHAYIVTPKGAECLLYRAHIDPGPTDVFIHKDRFPNLVTEYYPWPVEARDNFTTIQNPNGCGAKHNYDENYKIL